MKPEVTLSGKENRLSVSFGEILYYLFWSFMLAAKGLGLYEGMRSYNLILVFSFSCILLKLLLEKHTWEELLLKGGLLLLGGDGLLLGDDRLPLACGEDPDPGLVEVLGVVIRDYVLEVLLREVLDHGVRQHRLSRTGFADQHDVPLLRGGLAHHLHGVLLTDDPVCHQVGNVDLLGGCEGLFVRPLLHGELGPLHF